MYTAPINQPRKLGQFYVAMRTDGCLEKDLFLERMQKLSYDIANEPSQSNKKVMLPNDPEIASSKSRLKNGIPLDHLTV